MPGPGGVVRTEPRRIDLIILHGAVAANTIGLGVIITLLAELQDAYHLPTAGLGLVAAAAFIAAFLSFITLSRYADRGYAKTMLIVGTLGGALALVMAAYARGLWSLVLARAILGFAEGAFVPAARRLVLDWAPDRPGEVLGRILAASVAGFALGPVVGAILAGRFGLRVPFLVPAAILLLAVPAVARLRPPPPLPVPLSTADEQSLFSLLRNRLVLAGLAIGAIEFALIGSFDALWARLLSDLGASTVFIGMSFTLSAIPLVLLATRFGRLIDQKSPVMVGAVGMVVIVPAVLGYGWLTAPLILTLAAIVHSIGSAALAPAGATLVAAGSPPDMLARGQGLLEAVGFLAAAAASLPAGWAYENVGRGPWFSGLMALGVGLFMVGWWLARPQ